MRLKFSELTITSKIKFGFLTISILMIIISLCGIYYLFDAKNNIDKVYKQNFLPVTKISKAMILSEIMNSILRDEIRYNDEDYIIDSMQARKDLWDEITNILNEYEKLITTDKDRNLYKDFIGVREQYLSAIESIEAEAENNNDENAYTMIDVDSAMIANQYREALQSFIDIRDVSSGNSLLSIIAKNSRTALCIMIALAFIGILIAIIFILALSNNFKTITNKILSSINTVSESSNEFMKSNSALSDRTSQQASSVEETAATIEQVANKVKSNLAETENSVKLSKDTLNASEDGFKIYRKVEDQMNEIFISGQKITGIINMVNEIAFQTNILAINAAIEAAKGGEAGRGFAVVAIEVRNLAQRTLGAAKNIQELVNINKNQIETGMKYVKESTEKFEIINENINKLSSINESIVLASQEQHTGIEQIYTAISNIDETTQQNATLSEQISNTSKAMVETTDLCKDFLIKTFVGNTNQANEEDLTELEKLQE